MEHSPPFTDSDLRLIVTQAIKTSNIPLQRLIYLFDEYNAEPAWEYMEMPYRRTTQECKDAFETLRHGQPSPFSRQDTPSNPNKRKSAPGPAEPLSGGSGGSDSKRRYSAILGTEKGTQHILPKPPSTGSSPLISSFPAAAPTPKRRGRPPKVEVERRHQEAIARGEVLAPAGMGSMQSGPIRFSPTEGMNLSGYTSIAPAPSAPRSPATSYEQGPMRMGSAPEGSSGSSRRPRSSPRPPRVGHTSLNELRPETDREQTESAFRPGESMFSAQPQGSAAPARDVPHFTAPRETPPAGPRVESLINAPSPSPPPTAAQLPQTSPGRAPPRPPDP